VKNVRVNDYILADIGIAMLANLRRTIEAESGDILEADVNRFFWHIHFFLEYFLMLNEVCIHIDHHCHIQSYSCLIWL
jgi:hypothetical protein